MGLNGGRVAGYRPAGHAGAVWVVGLEDARRPKYPVRSKGRHGPWVHGGGRPGPVVGLSISQWWPGQSATLVKGWAGPGWEDVDG